MIPFLIFSGILLAFRSWFGFSPITSGDMGFFYPEQIRQYLNLPFAWETFREAGLGGNSFLFQGVYLYNLPMGFLGQFLDYGLIERLIWFWPILIVGLISPFLLAKELNLFPSKFYPFASLIFLLNTYFLMVMGGGQLTVILAYIMIPLVLVLFIKASSEANFKNIVFFSLSLIFLVAWDFRFVYLIGIILSLYLFYFLAETVKNIRKYLKIFLIAGLFVLGFHAFWLLPFLLNYQNPAASFTSAYTTSEAVRFFSFADFSHTLSLLHPNWPENIFGKTYFMQWEFLFLPILAFSSLLFLGNRHSGEERSDDSRIKDRFWTSQNNGEKTSNIIIYFALLGLIGAFLAKGSNSPFGGIYLWLFDHFPGMVMFRDPTKFYTLVALSYTILIPYSLWRIYDWISSKLKAQNSWLNFFLFFFTCFLLFLIKPAISGELGGTFKSKEVPKEYLELKNFIASQPEFFRTFWIPTKQRFAFYTDNHPEINGVEFLKVASTSGVINQLKEKDSQEKLFLVGVKYIILPFDSEEEIFLKDRKYDDQQRQTIEKELAKISWLKKVKDIRSIDLNQWIKIAVYENTSFKDRFWLESAAVLHSTVADNAKLGWKMIDPTKYEVKIKNQSSSVLVFSENFNPRWEIKINDKVISSERIYDRLNSFKIESTGNRQFLVEFKPQKYVYIGLLMSGFTLLLMLILLLRKNR